MKKIYLTLLFSILLIGLVGATNSLGAIKQSDCIEIPQVCASCTYVNLSVQYPNKSIAISNQAMTSRGAGLWTYENCDNLQLGRYDVSGMGDLNGVDTGFSVLWYEVSSLGIAQTTSQGIGSAVYLFLMLALAVLFGWMGFKLSESKGLWLLGIFFIFLAFLLVTYNVWLGYEYHRAFTGLENSAMPETIFYIFMFILVAGLIGSGALLFLRWKELYSYIKKEKQRMKEEEAFDGDFE